MFFTFGHLPLEEEFGPGTVRERLVGVLGEALMKEVGSALAAMDPVLVFATGLRDRGNAAVLLDGGSALVTGAFAAQGRGARGGPAQECFLFETLRRLGIAARSCTIRTGKCAKDVLH
jgi:hypothetical protein